MATIGYYKSDSTGELAPPHRIGTDEEGRALYRFVEGWEPVDSEGREIPGLRSGEGGNWFVDESPAESAAEMATRIGLEHREAYIDEFGSPPDRDGMGDWDSEGWSVARGEIGREHEEFDHDACQAAYFSALFGRETGTAR